MDSSRRRFLGAAAGAAALSAAGRRPGFAQQFPAVLAREPRMAGPHKLDSGKELLRLEFRVWPNRGALVETAFRQELEARLKRFSSELEPWMIVVAYEIEARTTARLGFSWLLGRIGSPAERRSRGAGAD